MSLETAIQENTAALRELIARLTSTAFASTEVAMAATEPRQETQVEEKKPAATPAAAETTAASGVTAVESRSEVVASIDYAKEVKPLLVKVSTTKGRDALVALLAKFNVTKGDQLPQDALPKVVAEVETLLAA